LVRWLANYAEHLLDDHAFIQTLASVPWSACPSERIRSRSISTSDELVEKLLMRYPVPPILYTPFKQEHLNKSTGLLFAHLASHVGGGGSLREAWEMGLLPRSFTRRMYRNFLHSTEHNPMLAYRIAQAEGMGMPRWVGICTHQSARYTGSRKLHSFWHDDQYWRDVIHWVGRHLENPNQAHPIMRYIGWNRPTLKGRTLESILREIELVHTTGRPSLDAPAYISAMFIQGLPSDFQDNGWDIKEILTPIQLWTEGQAMRHCVWSYHRHVRSGKRSIWSLKQSGVRLLTVEVFNTMRRIGQVKGERNRRPDANEWRVVQAWAQANGLQMVR